MLRFSALSLQTRFGQTEVRGRPTLATANPRYIRFGCTCSLRLQLTRGWNLGLFSLKPGNADATGELLILRRWLARWQQMLFLHSVPSLSAPPNHSLNLRDNGVAHCPAGAHSALLHSAPAGQRATPLSPG
jgi:hypothetical protein